MSYDHKLYLNNCMKMLRLNKEQVDLHLELYHKESDPKEKRNLAEEIRGWQNWVKIWEDRLEAAKKVTTN